MLNNFIFQWRLW